MNLGILKSDTSGQTAGSVAKGCRSAVVVILLAVARVGCVFLGREWYLSTLMFKFRSL